jgi:hypothetical protein
MLDPLAIFQPHAPSTSNLATIAYVALTNGALWIRTFQHILSSPPDQYQDAPKTLR